MAAKTEEKMTESEAIEKWTEISHEIQQAAHEGKDVTELKEKLYAFSKEHDVGDCWGGPELYE